jgi:hypothetical protein
MRNVSSLSGFGSVRSVPGDKKSQRSSIFAVLIDALHHARRLQAQRTLLQYRHLVARPDEIFRQSE